MYDADWSGIRVLLDEVPHGSLHDEHKLAHPRELAQALMSHDTPLSQFPMVYDGSRTMDLAGGCGIGDWPTGSDAPRREVRFSLPSEDGPAEGRVCSGSDSDNSTDTGDGSDELDWPHGSNDDAGRLSGRRPHGV